PPAAKQRDILETQLARIETWTSEGLAKPVIVHCRDAYEQLVPVLAASTLPPDRFVFHCFTGTPEEVDLVLDFGGWVSFTGIVTFKNAIQVAEASDRVPLDRLMVETDAPFLTPEPHRTTRPNEPKFVPHVADFLAQRRGMAPAELETVLDNNAQRFFGIELSP
ncbi:MAG: TatD family hydrolase, partial [Phycisphaerales bacterium]|nr:TatD family hydrolase [Phycisphaerales bacterium]